MRLEQLRGLVKRLVESEEAAKKEAAEVGPSGARAVSAVADLASLNERLEGTGLAVRVAVSGDARRFAVRFACDLPDARGRVVQIYLEDPLEVKRLAGRLGADLLAEIPWGSFSLGLGSEAGRGACGGAMTIFKTQAKAGWGILLYELCLEIASEEAAGLRADTMTVSDSAAVVWEKYLTRATKSGGLHNIKTDLPYGERRPAAGTPSGDVTAYGLDDEKSSLTPSPDDDCWAGSSRDRARAVNRSNQSPELKRWNEMPVNYRYYKAKPTVMPALRAGGLLVLE